MQNAGIYHIHNAAQMTAELGSSVPRGSAPGPPLSRATRSVSILPTFRTTSVVVFYINICCFIEKL